MNSSDTILLIGGCGSGKTWVMTQLISELKTINCKIGLIQFRMDETKKIAILGKYDGSIFQGSDKLSMSVMKDIERLARMQKDKKIQIIAEGDRFTNKRFVEIMNPTIVKILDDGIRGRINRGTNQTERQIKSIQTRVSNMQSHYDVQTSSEALELIKKISKA